MPLAGFFESASSIKREQPGITRSKSVVKRTGMDRRRRGRGPGVTGGHASRKSPSRGRSCAGVPA
jgi:hypothetical protein